MKKPAIFLCLTFLLSWPVAFLSFGSGMNLYTAGGLVVAVYFMFTPSISAVITQKLIYRQNLMSLGISFRPNGWFVVALLLPATIAMASTATSLFFIWRIIHVGPDGEQFFPVFQAESHARPSSGAHPLGRRIAHPPFFHGLAGRNHCRSHNQRHCGFWRGTRVAGIAPPRSRAIGVLASIIHDWRNLGTLAPAVHCSRAQLPRSPHCGRVHDDPLDGHVFPPDRLHYHPSRFCHCGGDPAWRAEWHSHGSSPCAEGR